MQKEGKRMVQTPIYVQRLTRAAFGKYGEFSSLLARAEKPIASNGLISFYPDCGGILNLGALGNNEMAIGICRVSWRETAIEVAEYHSYTEEGILPLDGDVCIHVALPTAGGEGPSDFDVFKVSQGTAVILKPGVWHHAPFALRGSHDVNVAILLPPRTYANDCIVRDISPPILFSA